MGKVTEQQLLVKNLCYSGCVLWWFHEGAESPQILMSAFSSIPFHEGLKINILLCESILRVLISYPRQMCSLRCILQSTLLTFLSMP